MDIGASSVAALSTTSMAPPFPASALIVLSAGTCDLASDEGALWQPPAVSRTSAANGRARIRNIMILLKNGMCAAKQSDYFGVFV